jgi:hypothetical protein
MKLIENEFHLTVTAPTGLLRRRVTACGGDGEAYAKEVFDQRMMQDDDQFRGQ